MFSLIVNETFANVRNLETQVKSNAFEVQFNLTIE